MTENDQAPDETAPPPALPAEGAPAALRPPSEAGEDAPAPSGAFDAAKERIGRLVERAMALLPWFSLAAGLIGGFTMDRSRNAAILVVGAAVLGWGAMVGFALLSRINAEEHTGWRRRLIKVGQLSVLVALQSLMQQCLLFALPFYAVSAALVPQHLSFLLFLALAAGVTLWDPLYERIVAVPFGWFSLQMLATFTSLNAMFPALGMSNRVSLFVTGAIVGLGIPLQVWLFSEPSPRRRKVVTWTAAGSVLGVPLFLLLGGAAVIPPAPLRIIDGGMGTQYADHQLQDPRDEIVGAPPQLVCATPIRAPHGLKEQLFHVWTHPDGHVTDKLELTIQGGRKEGFRTWSRKRSLGKNPWGTWTCSVVTASGQLINRFSIDVVQPGS